MPTTTTSQPPILILAPPCAGAECLTNLLADHPQLFVAHELHLLSAKTLSERETALANAHKTWQNGLAQAIATMRAISFDQAEAMLETFVAQNMTTAHLYRQLQAWLGQRRLVELTPHYTLTPDTLRRAETLFEAPLYLHLTRHPYGMLQAFEKSNFDQFYPPNILNRDQHAFSRRELAELVWLISYRNILDHLETVPQARQLTLKFETLVQQPQITMAALFGFLNLNCRAKILNTTQKKNGFLSQPEVTDTWRTHYRVDFLRDMTWHVATLLGYSEGLT